MPEKIARWKLLEGHLRLRLEELPHLTGLVDELAQVITEAEALQLQFEKTRADWQEVSKQRDELVRAGEELRGRATAAVQAELGFTSRRLLEFGLKPRNPGGRPRKATTPAPAPTPAPTPEK